MKRLTRTGMLIAGLALAAAFGIASAQSLPQRQSFDIATGPVAGTFFPMGEMIARAVSHPPGLGRCEKRGVCGPAGIIVSARTSDGAVANVLAVNAGEAASGLAPGNVVADAVAGRGAFKKYGRQSHIRVMADLYPEAVQLVVPARSPIKTVADLRGRRVSIGGPQSGADVIASEILAAYGVRGVKIVRETYEISGGLMREGKLDAFFFLGGAPTPLIADLVERLHARLIPIDGAGRSKLVAKVKGLSPVVIPAGAYRGTGQVQTVSCHTLWVVKDSASADAVYGLVRALYNPANRPVLNQGPTPAGELKLGEQISHLSVPWHPGALRFYRETGQLPLPMPPKTK